MYILATDVDNTIASTSELFDPIIKEKTELDLKLCCYEANRLIDPNADSIIDAALVEMRKDGQYSKLVPKVGAVNSLRAFAGAGNKVIYVTSRAAYYDKEDDAAEELSRWLFTNGFPNGDIAIVNGVQEKVDFAIRRNAHILADDLSQVMDELLARRTSIHPLLVNEPWNADYANTYINRLPNWKHFAGFVLTNFGAII